jgi:PHD/YefM family antitoxin component YafN of YafNO toxin-antitoxin module
MPIIKSISSLRNHAREISSLCHKENEPVFLTTNGESDLVVMSMQHYERMKAELDLFEKLSVAQSQSAAGEKGIPHAQMVQALKQRLHGK